jgi:hypothetical protein
MALMRRRNWLAEWLGGKAKPIQNASTVSQPTQPTPAGRKVATDDYETRKRVAERWDSFSCNYKTLGYTRCTWENFAAWASEKFDDMPSDDHAELKRMVDAYRKTPNPRNLV